jgi:predicted deacetylase
MIPRPAQYLLRFDDLCPTIHPQRWEEYRKVVAEFGIRPILAVVPRNEDSDLERSPADPEFWEQIRAMEAAGATVAVHGYRHRCESRGESLLGLHRRSEFAGVEFGLQREWIREGFRIVRDQGLHPRLWIAPRHGFDRNTLRALREAGVEYISDGLARIPFRRDGINWIPQQLWRPVTKHRGLWTICLHPYAAGSTDVERLQRFLENHHEQFTSFDRVVKEFPARRLSLWEHMYERIALKRVQKRHRRRRKKRR